MHSNWLKTGATSWLARWDTTRRDGTELLRQWRLEQAAPVVALDLAADEALLRAELVLLRVEALDQGLELVLGLVQHEVLDQAQAAAGAEGRAPLRWARRTKPVRRAKRM
jgi:hypothetical protein